VFGLVWGTVTVSLASTTAAALAFLIARYLARDKVTKQALRYPKFRAIDGAIGAGGWKIIAMLRLSPAMPFSLGNYLFGLTAIRLWPYVVTNWLFMLPGTFMYVYLGNIGTEELRSATGAERAKTPAEWALLGVGLLATIAVTVYVTRLSRKALRQRTRIGERTLEPEQLSGPAEQNAAVATGWPWGATVHHVDYHRRIAYAGRLRQGAGPRGRRRRPLERGDSGNRLPGHAGLQQQQLPGRHCHPEAESTRPVDCRGIRPAVEELPAGGDRTRGGTRPGVRTRCAGEVRAARSSAITQFPHRLSSRQKQAALPRKPEADSGDSRNYLQDKWLDTRNYSPLALAEIAGG
jgi:hypothetical protein